jgi:hypothetical protein
MNSNKQLAKSRKLTRLFVLMALVLTTLFFNQHGLAGAVAKPDFCSSMSTACTATGGTTVECVKDPQTDLISHTCLYTSGAACTQASGYADACRNVFGTSYTDCTAVGGVRSCTEP